jgi:hypothetical protein
LLPKKSRLVNVATTISATEKEFRKTLRDAMQFFIGFRLQRGCEKKILQKFVVDNGRSQRQILAASSY